MYFVGALRSVTYDYLDDNGYVLLGRKGERRGEGHKGVDPKILILWSQRRDSNPSAPGLRKPRSTVSTCLRLYAPVNFAGIDV